MFNDIVIGPVTFHMYGLMIAVGFLFALYFSIYRGKKKGLSEDILWGILGCAVIGGFLGTRILYYIVEWKEILADPSILWDFTAGYVVYGGIIGGVLASYIYVQHIKKIAFIDYFDLVMPSVSAAQGFGRIGCFCAGCCYGKETDSWFHVTFHHSSFAPNNVDLIPTQLLSSAGDFLFFALLLYFSTKTKVKGRVAAAYFMLYGVGRFVIEFFRGDEVRGFVGVLSTSQLISIGIFAFGVLFFVIAPKFPSNRVQEVEE